MDKSLIKWQEHPARTFLRRYRFMCVRQDALIRAIDEAHSRAMSCTVRLKTIRVTGNAGAYDRMAEDVSQMVDAETQLWMKLQDLRNSLADVLAAIDSVPDEAQKTVLTLRYINGCEWSEIQDYMHYERTQVYVIHGWALQAVKRWMDERTKTD